MFMQYYGGGVGHRGMTARTSVAIDDVEVDPEWQDIASDADSEDPADIEDEVPAVAECPDDLLKLVPEVLDGAFDAALVDRVMEGMEEGTERDEEEGDLLEWEIEDDDGRTDSEAREDDDVDADGLVDECTQVGYAPL